MMTQNNVLTQLYIWVVKVLSHSLKHDGSWLDQELLNFLLNSGDLGLDLRSFVLGDRGGDHRAGDAAGAAEGLLGPAEDVGDVLVLAEQRDVEEDLQRLGVGGEHDELGLAAVEGLGGLVGTLAQLLVVDGLLDQVEDLGGELLLGQGVGLGVHFAVSLEKRGD